MAVEGHRGVWLQQFPIFQGIRKEKEKKKKNK